MVNTFVVEYVGDISPCRIKVGNSLHKNWHRGETRELDEEATYAITKNKDFKVVGDKPKTEKKEEKKEEIDFDLNDDGVFDEKDRSLAGKVLSSKRKK